jgi:hypothetical protein
VVRQVWPPGFARQILRRFFVSRFAGLLWWLFRVVLSPYWLLFGFPRWLWLLHHPDPG